MESIFNFFQGFFKEFTWSRFTFLVFTIFIALSGLIVYELYTNHLKLNRINNELKIAKSIVEIEEKINSLPESSTSRKYFLRLISQIEDNPKEFRFHYNLPTKKLQRIAYQAAPWVIMLLLAIFATKDERGSLVGGIFLIASPLVILGYNLPEPDEKWIINYLYPWGTFAAVMILILYAQRKK